MPAAAFQAARRLKAGGGQDWPPSYSHLLYVKSMVLLSFAPTVICWSIVPYVSCQACSVLVPAGKLFIVNVPSSPVTAKNGWWTTPIYARIQGCTLHLTGIITSSRGKLLVLGSPLGGCDSFHSWLILGSGWMLWFVGSSFRMSMGWFVITARTCGVYIQPF